VQGDQRVYRLRKTDDHHRVTLKCLSIFVGCSSGVFLPLSSPFVMGSTVSRFSKTAPPVPERIEEEVAADVPSPEDTEDVPAPEAEDAVDVPVPEDAAQEPAIVEASEPCATSQMLCCVCGTPCSQRCSRCKKQTYCGEAHMEQVRAQWSQAIITWLADAPR
jgi:hypothetical protein